MATVTRMQMINGFHANCCSKLSHANDFSCFFNFHWNASSAVKKHDVVWRLLCVQLLKWRALKRRCRKWHCRILTSLLLKTSQMPLSEGSQQHSNSLRFLITLEGKLMLIHNRLLLKHPLEMAAVTDTNAAIQSPVCLSIREAVLNICSEEGKRCRAYRSGRTCSLSIPQGSAFGPEDSRYYWKYSHSPSAGLQLRTMQIIYPAELESKPLRYEIFHRTIQ